MGLDEERSAIDAELLWFPISPKSEQPPFILRSTDNLYGNPDFSFTTFIFRSTSLRCVCILFQSAALSLRNSGANLGETWAPAASPSPGWSPPSGDSCCRWLSPSGRDGKLGPSSRCRNEDKQKKQNNKNKHTKHGVETSACYYSIEKRRFYLINWAELQRDQGSFREGLTLDGTDSKRPDKSVLIV